MNKSAQIQRLTERCSTYLRTVNRTRFMKTATMSDDGQDTSFEQAFSSLAHAYLREKAPSLLEYELGFQLIDRNPESTKAVGIFAFAVGEQELYAPVFFLAGELKGHELLYLKNQDVFVPLKENWLNHVIGQKPPLLGDAVTTNTSELGVNHPELARLSTSPKYASVRGFLPRYSYSTRRDMAEIVTALREHTDAQLDLTHFLKQASTYTLTRLVNTFNSYPQLAHAYDRWHGLAGLQDIVKEAQVRESQHSILDDPYVWRTQDHTGSILEKSAAKDDDGPTTHQKIEIITIGATLIAPPEDLSDDEREKLYRDRVLIKDERAGDEVSVAVNLQTRKRLTNPSQTGIYDVLVKPGTFEQCLVVAKPHGPDGRKDFCVVVRLDEKTKNWCTAPVGEIWVLGAVGSSSPAKTKNDWETWFDKLPDGKLSESHGYYMAVHPKTDGTIPFHVCGDLGDHERGASYEVDFANHEDSRYSSSAGLYTYRDTARTSKPRWDRYDPHTVGARVHLDNTRGTQFRSNRGELYIPEVCKILSLEPAVAQDCCLLSPFSPARLPAFSAAHSEVPPIQLGNIIDAEMEIRSKTAELKIFATPSGYSINEAPLAEETTALIELVVKHGLREDVSRDLLKQARVKAAGYKKPFVCRIKYASPFLADTGPTAPPVPPRTRSSQDVLGTTVPTWSRQIDEVPVTSMQSNSDNLAGYDIRPASDKKLPGAEAVMQAAESGQREIFDTAMIASLLQTTQDENLIDQYLPDIMTCIDHIGELLLKFYWQQERFAERYGKQDMPELEDTLRNAFDIIGDLALFLKQKTIEPYPEEDVHDVDLGDVSGNY